MRSILHPGIPSQVKISSVSATLESVEVTLNPGSSLLNSMIAALEPFQVQSAVLRLAGGVFEPFCYVMPALSRSKQHSVYFSERYDVAGQVSLESACVTVGLRDNKPWLHCHAVWIEPDGTRRCGHLLPEDVHVAQPIQASVSVLRGATFNVMPDSETNFSLFVPTRPQSKQTMTMQAMQPMEPMQAMQAMQPMQAMQATAPHTSLSGTGLPQRAYALRLSPNVDVCTALENFCAEHQIAQAVIHGGVGSTVGAVFEDDRIVEPFVTEMLIRQGSIQTDANGQLCAQLDISMVDYKGGISEGRLKRGENPVLVTFELVLQPV